MELHPRLVSDRARQIAAQFAAGDLVTIDALARAELDQVLTPVGTVEGPGIEFGATGGGRVGRGAILAHRDALHDFAVEHGFEVSDACPPLADARALDAQVAVYLHTRFALTRHEATQGGIWAFYGCLVGPAMIRWRFASEKTDIRRFVGSRVRNYFARLWWRAETLHDDGAEDRYWLLRVLGEDEQVQLTERARLIGCRALVMPVARHFVDAIEKNPAVPRMKLMRELTKRMLRLLGIVAYEMLTVEQREDAARQLVDETLRGMGHAPGSTHATPTAPLLPAPDRPLAVLDPPAWMLRAFARLALKTVGQLADADLTTAEDLPGVGATKLDAMREMAATARRLISPEPPQDALLDVTPDQSEALTRHAHLDLRTEQDVLDALSTADRRTVRLHFDSYAAFLTALAALRARR